jgi:hypothetical protein
MLMSLEKGFTLLMFRPQANHLVHMIYLDQMVEDSELEVASIYASRLGFKEGMVGDLFKSIATIEFDRTSHENVRKEVIDFLKLQKI